MIRWQLDVNNNIIIIINNNNNNINSNNNTNSNSNSNNNSAISTDPPMDGYKKQMVSLKLPPLVGPAVDSRCHVWIPNNEPLL